MELKVHLSLVYFLLRTQAQRPEPHFINSTTLFHLEIHLINQNILLAGCVDHIMLESRHIVSQNGFASSRPSTSMRPGLLTFLPFLKEKKQKNVISHRLNNASP